VLSKEEFTSCIDALVEMGAVERGEGDDKRETLCLRVKTEGLIGRVVGGEFGEPPGGSGLLPWFSCILLKTLLEERDFFVTKDEFTGMAAVIAGFMSEAETESRLHAVLDKPLVSQRRARSRRKQMLGA
jgi:hypothetical protein